MVQSLSLYHFLNKIKKIFFIDAELPFVATLSAVVRGPPWPEQIVGVPKPRKAKKSSRPVEEGKPHRHASPAAVELISIIIE